MNKPIPYSCAIPIQTSSASVWLIEFSDGKKMIQVWNSAVRIDRVTQQLISFYPDQEFTVSNIEAGEFNLETEHPISHSRSCDPRKVNQDMKVV